MFYQTRIRGLALFFSGFLLLPSSSRCQAPDPGFTRMDEATLDALALRIAKRIREAHLEEKQPSVLVVDFFRNSAGSSSELGTLLADKFSEYLAAYTDGFKILDRGILKDYLIQNWTTLEDLQSKEACLGVARQLGATGVITGTLYEEKDQIALEIELVGFGPVPKGADVFQWTQETDRFPATEGKRTLLFHPGPDYARKADEIPEEPGILRASKDGVTTPRCMYCPQPRYSNAARTAKFQGKVIVSVVVTIQGAATSIYVVKGAPLGLTAQAIEAIKLWRFEPAQKDGQPVASRVPIEITFRLY